MGSNINTDLQTAAVIIIGNEILSGRTRDSNTALIADKLGGAGIRLREVRIINDDEDDIVHAVNALRERVDYVFTTGGIGPTHDDITAAAVAKAFNLDLYQDPTAHAWLESYYGEKELTQERLKMAVVPEGARLIENQISAAPGFNIGNVYVMAGIPRIMSAMLDKVLEKLDKGPAIKSATITCQLAESMIAKGLAKVQAAHPDAEIGSYPHYKGGVPGLSLVIRTTQDDVLEATRQDLIAAVRDTGCEPEIVNITKAAPDEGEG